MNAPDLKRGQSVRARIVRRAWRLLALGLSLLALGGCENAPSALDPQGPPAARIATLWWLMFGISSVIYVLVMGLLFWGLLRRRQEQPENRMPLRGSTRWIVAGGIALPIVILTIVYGFSLWTMGSISAFAASPAMTIEVIGRQWWWEVRYPEQGFETANEIHIPVGKPVAIKLTSADVTHSFWIPKLNGKLDMIPGKTNTIVIQADQAGEYRGECNEFCGTQHAKMAFVVVAEPEDTFAAWLAQQRQESVLPTTALLRHGQQVFLGAACVYCHAIRGTNASSDFGPDLTHLASRRTLAAGTLPNNRGNLAGWILNPQSIKPGNKMPPVNLDSQDLQALLAYLESLK